MKRIFLNTLFFVFCTILFVSCEKTSEEAEGHSTFYLSMPTFASPNGEKTHWDSRGLWWDESGDVVRIAGNNNSQESHRISYDGVWKTTGNAVSPAANGEYYICYMGKSVQDGCTWNYDNKEYQNVNSTNIVPLVGHGNTNFITLHPCCAVLRFINVENGYTIQATFPQNDVFPKRGSISVKDNNYYYVDSTVTEYFQNAGLKATSSNNVATIVLPMKENSHNFDGSIMFSATKRQSTLYSIQTRPGITIQRGYVYEIDCLNWTGWTPTQ